MSNNNRHEEIVIVPPTLVETQALPLITDTQYLENFTSESLNRTFLGIVSKGIFKGFNVELSGGLGVIIKRDTGLGLSIARYERDNYQISVRQQHDINLTFAAGKTSYAVIEAQYKFGVITSQVDVRSGINAATIRVIDESALASHHIVICKATVPDGATELDVAHITYIERLEGGFDLTGHQNHPDPHPQYVRKDHSATDEEIDDESNSKKFIELPQLWRALSPQRLIEKLWLGLAAKICPVGSSLPWETDIAPEGWAIRKGQAFDKIANPKLAEIWPDGIIPDMRGNGFIGKEDGEIVGVFEEGQVKEHGHEGSSVGSTDLGSKNTNTTGHHAHNTYTSGRDNGNNGYDGNYPSGSSNPISKRTSPYTTDGQGNHLHSVSIGSHAHTVMIALFGALKNTINHRKCNWIVRLA